MNLVLIGYRGTGKSVIAELLSKRLNMQCLSLDAEIAGKAGMSIPRFVEKYGWEKFRDLESTLTEELARQDKIIIDTGGGVIERWQNIENLKKNGLIFWLRASVAVIVSRIAAGTERPALVAGKTFTEEVAEVLARRTAKYAAASRFQIDTDSLATEHVADIIIKIWNEEQSKTS